MRRSCRRDSGFSWDTKYQFFTSAFSRYLALGRGSSGPRPRAGLIEVQAGRLVGLPGDGELRRPALLVGPDAVVVVPARQRRGGEWIQ